MKVELEIEMSNERKRKLSQYLDAILSKEDIEKHLTDVVEDHLRLIDEEA